MDLQKRTAVAVGLSIVIIVIYSAWVSKHYPTVDKGVTQNITREADIYQPSVPIKSLPEIEQKQEMDIDYTPLIIEKDNVVFEFSPRGGNLITVEFKEYKHKVAARGLLKIANWSDLEFSHRGTQDSIIFTYKDEQKEIIKEYKISSGGFYVELQLTYRNLTPSLVSTSYALTAEFLPSSSSLDQRYREASVMLKDGNILRNNTLRIKKGSSRNFDQPLKWIGFRDKYFAYILYPLSAEIRSAQIGRSLEGNDTISLNRTDKSLGPEGRFQDNYLFYCGPQQTDLLVQAEAGFEQIRNYGKLDAIVKFLLASLVNIHKVVHNWGVAIIILTIAIYLCLYPLTLKQMRSMKKMQVLQPEMEALRKQHKDSPQKLNKEVMELYRRHKANPLGGCLPIIFQIPVFFSLFQALSRGIELKGARFLWIKDLTEPDRLFVAGGKDINLLPILMMTAMFFQQRMSMRNMSGTQGEQQKMMLWLMPIVFGFIFYNMPSGLVLYWFTNSLLMMVSQWKALK